MTKDLKQKTMHGLLWSSLERFGQQGILFFVGIVLARNVAPEQFGLIAMLAIFTLLANCLVDSGFAQALIRKKDLSHTDICSVFYFNIVISIAIWILLCLISPWIAAFYEEPILRPLVCVMGLTFVFNSFGMIHKALLTRNIQFKSQFLVSVPSIVVSGTASITAALYGLEVWALAIQSIVSALVSSILYWTVDKWRPSLTFSMDSLREMFGFGSKLLASAILRVIFSNAYVIIIGKLYNTKILGYYSQAFKLLSFPTTNISAIISQVSYPIFAQIQDDPTRLRYALKKSIKLLSLFSAPAMIGLAIIAEPLIVTLIGKKWLPCVPYFQIMCIAGFNLPINTQNVFLIQAIGKGSTFLWLEILKKILIVINIALFYRFGVMAMLIGEAVLSFVAFGLNTYYNGKFIAYGPWKQFRDILPYIAACLPMVGVCYCVSLGHTNEITKLSFTGISLDISPELMILLKQVPAGIITWIVTCRLLKLESFMESWNHALRLLPLKMRIKK